MTDRTDVVRGLVDRLIETGAIEEPDDGYTVEWPEVPRETVHDPTGGEHRGSR